MKILKIILLVTFAILLHSCNSRKVTTSLSKNDDKSQFIELKKDQKISLDTSKMFFETNNVKTDTASYEVDIIPDSNKIMVVRGNFSGHASKVIIKGNGKEKQVLDKIITQQNHVTITTKNEDSTETKKNVSIYTKNKQSDSAPSIYPWIAIVISVLIIVVAVYLYLKGVF